MARRGIGLATPRTTQDVRVAILKKTMVNPENGCWLWQGVGKGQKYFRGSIHWQGQRVRAYRAAYIAFIGNISKGLLVCHKCDNPRCVNPFHLFLGTHQDNHGDCVAKGRNFRPIGELSNFAKLTENQVIEIIRRVKNGESKKEVAKDYPTSYRSVRAITAGSVWKHLAAREN